MTRSYAPLLVVGGGIGGLATALAAAQRGIETRLLEQAPEFAEVGAGLQMGPNATRALDRLGLLDLAMATAVKPAHGILLDAISGRELTRLDLGPRFLARYGYPYVVMHRSDLLGVLLQACSDHPLVSLESNRTAIGVTTDGTAAEVRCADGSTHAGGAVIGADGLHSVVRQIMFDASAPTCSGYVAYRGTMPAVEVGTGAQDDVLIWIGPQLHLVQYPVRAGNLYNQVAVFGSSAYQRGEAVWGTTEELDERFADTCGAVKTAVGQIQRDRHWQLFDREPLHSWTDGNVALLGDAAHPMLQYLGQGACQSLEDALVVAEQLAQHPGDVPLALKAYERDRLPKASRCQMSARPWGQVWHSDDPIVSGLRDRLLSQRAWHDYEEVDWLYADHAAAEMTLAAGGAATSRRSR